MQDNKIYATYAGKRLYNFNVSFKNFPTGNKYTCSKVSLVLSEVLPVTERLNLKSNNVCCFFLGDIFFSNIHTLFYFHFFKLRIDKINRSKFDLFSF